MDSDGSLLEYYYTSPKCNQTEKKTRKPVVAEAAAATHKQQTLAAATTRRRPRILSNRSPSLPFHRPSFRLPWASQLGGGDGIDN